MFRVNTAQSRTPPLPPDGLAACFRGAGVLWPRRGRDRGRWGVALLERDRQPAVTAHGLHGLDIGEFLILRNLVGQHRDPSLLREDLAEDGPQPEFHPPFAARPTQLNRPFAFEKHLLARTDWSVGDMCDEIIPIATAALDRVDRDMDVHEAVAALHSEWLRLRK